MNNKNISAEKLSKKDDTRHIRFIATITVLTILLAVIITLSSVNIFTDKTKENAYKNR